MEKSCYSKFPSSKLYQNKKNLHAQYGSISPQRKLSAELLGSVKLRPSYFSFPTPRLGRSPTIPTFQLPRYDCYDLEELRNDPERRDEETYLIESNDFHSLGTSSTLRSVSSLFRTPKVSANQTFGSRKLSILEASISSLNYFTGVGILMLPYALSLSGWIGLVGMLLCSLFTAHSGRCISFFFSKYYLESLPDIAEFAYGSMGRSVASFIYYLQLLFEIGVFCALISTIISDVISISMFHARLITFILLTFIVNISNKGMVKRLNSIGSIASQLLYFTLLIILILKTYELSNHFRTFPRYLMSGKIINRHIIMQRSFLNHTRSFGIFAFSFSGNVVYPRTFQNMADNNSESYHSVVNLTSLTMTLLYFSVACLGYLLYGESLSGNVVHSFATKSWQYISIQIFTAVMILAKIPITADPLASGIRESFAACSSDSSQRSLDNLMFESEYLNQVIKQKAHRRSQLKAYQLSLAGWDEKLDIVNSYQESSNKIFNNQVEEIEVKEEEETPFEIATDISLHQHEPKEEPEIKESSPRKEVDLTNKCMNFPAAQKSPEKELILNKESKELSISLPIFEPDYLRRFDHNVTRVDESNSSNIGIHTLVQAIAFTLSLQFCSVERMLIFAGGVFGVIASFFVPMVCYWRIIRHENDQYEKYACASLTFGYIFVIISSLLCSLYR